MQGPGTPSALPALRDELALLSGPMGADGAPSWTLHDPLSNRFYRLSWPAFEILSRWHLGPPDQVAARVNHETALDIEPQDVLEMAQFLRGSHLLKINTAREVDMLLAQHDAAQTSWLTWLLHHYLFFRIPLVRPDDMLSRALPWVRWLGSRAFHLATLAALLLGLFFVTRQWDVFAATFVDHVSLSGLAAFGIALGFAKIVHELGHAFTAKTFGCRVPAMGVAFLVMWPMLYTDVNEAWKLTDRRRRLLVGGAGILSELVIAAWATLAWGLLPPDSAFKSMAFTLAATTWITSLAINLSPFMRFDGYFLAMDALDQPNLHPRSFALARWHLREILFGLGEPVPEPLPDRTRLGMIVFAWAVWLYRLALFLGIAILVYHFFIKVVGIVLFVVEIGWFVVKPLWSEIKEWLKRGPYIRHSRRARVLLAGLGGLIMLTLVPWNGRISAPALLKAEHHVGVFAPVPALLVGIDVADGQSVVQGATLARLENPDITRKLEQVTQRIGVLKYELSSIGFDDTFRTRSKATAEQLEGALAEQATLMSELARLTLTASQAGVVGDLSHDLHAGQWINPREALLSIRNGAIIEAYVAETDLPRLQLGGAASFIPEGSGATLDATIAALDRVAVKSLNDPVMAVQYGGSIPARFDRKILVPDMSVYRVRLAVPNGAAPLVPVRGQAHLEGERRSPIAQAFYASLAILIREWGM